MNLQEFLGRILGFLGIIPALIVSITLAVFLWKLTKQMASKDSIDAKSLRGTIWFGLLVLLVMTTLWAIISVIQSVFFPGGVFTNFKV